MPDTDAQNDEKNIDDDAQQVDGGEGDGDNPKVEALTLTPDQLKAVREAAIEEFKKKQAEVDEATELEQLQAAGELEKANKRLNSKVDELKAQRDGFENRAVEAEAALAEYVTQLEDGVDETILTLLEGRTPAQRLKWLIENRDKFVQSSGGDSGGDGSPVRQGNPLPKSPNRKQKAGRDLDEKAEQEALLKSRRITRMAF